MYTKSYEPEEAVIKQLQALYDMGKYEIIYDQTKVLTKKHPKSVLVNKFLGLSCLKLNNFQDALKTFKKLIELEPNNSDWHLNLGAALQSIGRPQDAVVAIGQSISIKNDNPIAYNNLGNALASAGNTSGAIKAYSLAISCKPDYAYAYNNLGNVLHEIGNIRECIMFYSNALEHKKNYTKAYINLLKLNVQLSNIQMPKLDENNFLHSLSKNQLFLIYNAITNYVLGNLAECRRNLSEYSQLKKCKIPPKLDPIDAHVCSAYHKFLSSLLRNKRQKLVTTYDKLFHLGESHCLSFAHHNIDISGKTFSIIPKLTLGAKAYHFASGKNNPYKSITEAHINSLPDCSNLIISFGEIDCRAHEGILKAQSTSKKPLKEIVVETVDGYVEWVLRKNIYKKHKLNFINVPAPTYKPHLSKQINRNVSDVIRHFNNSLADKLDTSNLKLVDVYQYTVDNSGFSNGLYHCDDTHLDSRIMPKINQILS